MLILGLILIAVGALVIVAAVGTAEGTNVELLGTDLGALALFLVGVGAGVSVLLGFTISKYGTKRTLQHRREKQQLNELSEKLDRVEAERRRAVDEDRDPSPPHL